MGNLSKDSCSDFTAREDHWWRIFTSSPQFCQQIKRLFAHQLNTDGVSVGVVTFKKQQAQPPPPAKSKKRKHNASKPSAWVQGLPANTPITAARIIGLDPGRNSLFTAVIHEEHATNHLQAPQPIKHQVLSWSRSRWQEVSGIKHAKLMRELWIHDDPTVMENLLDTPTPKAATTVAFGRHIFYRLTHMPATVTHYGARKYRQLRWSLYMQKQRAMASMCNSITGGKRDTIVAYGDAKFACCGKGNEATPTTSIRKKLGAACRVYDVDEFRTSKLCCACHHAMAGMPLPSMGNNPQPAWNLHEHCAPACLQSIQGSQTVLCDAVCICMTRTSVSLQHHTPTLCQKEELVMHFPSLIVNNLPCGAIPVDPHPVLHFCQASAPNCCLCACRAMPQRWRPLLQRTSLQQQRM